MKRSARIVLVGAIVAAVSAAPTLADPPYGSTPFSGAFQFRLGGAHLTGNGDFWQESQDVFTLKTNDFNDFVLGLTYVTPINRNLEVGFNVDFYNNTVASAYGDWVDGAGFPILHDSNLRMIPMMVDLRVVPGGRFSAAGQYLRRKPAFYLGGGVGVNYWQYEEVGDFLDFGFDPPDIFFDRFVDDGFAPAAEALAGFEFPMGKSAGLVLEGRYLWSDAELDGDFAGLGTIEFDGPSVYLGFSFSF